MSEKSQAGATPLERIASKIREEDATAKKWMGEAKKTFEMAAIFGGTAIALAVGGDGPILVGTGGAAAIYLGVAGFYNLSTARTAAQEAGLLRQTLNQHELNTGEAIEIYPEEIATEPEPSASDVRVAET